MAQVVLMDISIIADYRRAVLATEFAWRNVLDIVADGSREEIDDARTLFEMRVRDESAALTVLAKS